MGRFHQHIHEFVWDMAGNKIFFMSIKTAVIVFHLLSVNTGYCQADSSAKYKYEISFSYDQSVSSPDIPLNKGFGLGLTHIIGKKKMIRFTIAYNFQFIQRQEIVYAYSFDGPSGFVDSRISYAHFSTPMTLRFFVGNKFRILIEPGICPDLLVFTRIKGEGKEAPFLKIDEFLQYERFNFCPMLAVGMQYAVGKHIITTKAELKYALNLSENENYLEDLNRYWRIVTAFQF